MFSAERVNHFPAFLINKFLVMSASMRVSENTQPQENLRKC